MPEVAFTAAVGIAVVVAAGALSRTGRPYAAALFWAGMAAMVIPAVVRLTSTAARRGERVALVLVVGMALYVVKVVRDPIGFTYPDEFLHAHNLLEILRSGRLFGENPLLPVTSFYPGLESVAAAVRSLSGLSPFTAALVVIGAARLVMVGALFVLLERVSGSARVAGVAVVVYVATPTFVFFSAQFSYESLALPLAVLAVTLVVSSSPVGGGTSWGTVAAAVVVVLAVVVTHHMTAYALTTFLVLVCAASARWGKGDVRGLWVVTAVALVTSALWLSFVARQTFGYLGPILVNAVDATMRTAVREQPPRQLFSPVTGPARPALERAVALVAAAIAVAAQPLGLPEVWRRARQRPVAAVLMAASVGYVGSLALRVVPGAWETGARASEFLFIGCALVVAAGCLLLVERVPGRRAGRWLASAAVGVLVAGGVIAGWSRLWTAQPYRVTAAGGSIDPEGVNASRWAGAHLPSASTVAAGEADARMLLVEGGVRAIAGTYPDVIDVLRSPALEGWQVDLLADQGVSHVMTDARPAAADVMAGYTFPATSGEPFPQAAADVMTGSTQVAGAPAEASQEDALAKFERAGASRVFDSGNIAIDDVSSLTPEAGR